MDTHDLEGIPLFADLSRKDRARVAAHADMVDLPAGHHLMDQGTSAHEFFVLVSGAVTVTREGEHIADLGPGDFFGEIALVEHGLRTATCTAATPISAIVMHHRDFDSIRHDVPHIADRIEDAVRERSPAQPGD